jgi:hypothetical protein
LIDDIAVAVGIPKARPQNRGARTTLTTEPLVV